MLVESCAQEVKQEKKGIDSNGVSAVDTIKQPVEKQLIVQPTGTTVETRILPPTNFERTKANDHSFAAYLRGLPVKPHGAEVMLYDGTVKQSYRTYDAVIDLKIGKKNLHQCADAVMRLRAEYLWKQKRYEDIHFNFTNGFRVDYTKWMSGQRIVVQGNKSHWVNRASPSNTYNDFWKYMELIFTYAGTLSLSKELVPVEIEDIKIGDVFIEGGSPGHAILVTDMAIHSITKEKIFLLAQSYMPAQETHLLYNPDNSALSPWYAVKEIEDELNTPDWFFNVKDLKRFRK